jgi:sensor histidine kinase YesM
LQPIVENAFIHGLRNARGTLFLRIYAETAGGADWIVVEDDGCGIEAEALDRLNAGFLETNRDEKEHIGLKNVNARLRLFYGERYRLRVESVPGAWTRVFIPMPASEEGVSHEQAAARG